MSSRPVHLALAALCLAGAFALFCLPIANPDLFWHLSAGQWMAGHMAFPYSDWLSNTMSGKPWVDFEWLPQALYFAVMKGAGLGGLWALKVVLFCVAGWMLWKALGRYKVRPASRAFGVFFWALSLSYAGDLRPENISLILFIILWSRLEAWRVRGRDPGRLQMLWLAFLFAAWANVHAGFLCGLLLIGAYAAVQGLARRAWKPAALLGVCALAAVLNPYGLRVYSVAFGHAADLGLLGAYIREWQPPSLRALWLWPFWAGLAVSLTAVLWRRLRHKDVPWEHAAALGLFAALALLQARAVAYFMCVAVPAAAAALARWKLPERRPRLAAALLGGALAASCGVVSLAAARGELRASLWPGFFDDSLVPAGAARFLEDEGQVTAGHRLFNPWHWGGYLGWKLQPDLKVFADGRYIFHPLLAPMYEAAHSPKDYADFLARYGVDLAAVERAPQYRTMPVDLGHGRSGEALRPFYLEYYPEDRWALVYWDRKSLVFARRDAFPPGWLADKEYRLFRPDDFEATGLRLRSGAVSQEAVRREAERFAEQHPELARG